MYKNVFITGTPCTGKTTVSEVLSERLGCKLIKINDLAIENDFILGIDEEKGYKVIDIPRLNDKVSEIISGSDDFIIFEGHLVHLCSGADKVIVLRVRPEILRSRLEGRNYTDAKIRENLEAEAMGVCTAEAYDIYGESICEIDASDLAVDEIVELLINVLDGDVDYPVGEVDFMDWLINPL